MRIIGLAGWSGSGKTTLLAKVIPRLVVRGLKVSTLKHAHHGFDVDQPGKDSHTHRAAGATEVLVSSANRWALVHELRGQAEPALGALLAKLSPVDLVLVEGYKREPHPKLEVYRAGVGKPLLHPDDPAIVAVASDEPLPAARVPVVEVERIIRERVTPVAEVETVPLHAASGRVVAREVVAPIDLPPFDNSAVDGYAVRHADLDANAETRLAVVERVTAGRAAARVLDAGAAVRIFTGAPMPAGADTVFMQEDARLDGKAVIVPAGRKVGANRRLAGEDVRAGSIVLPAGLRLAAQHVALAAAIGPTALDVFRRVRVAVFSTGDEIVEPGTARPSAALFDANRYLLAGLIERLGATSTDLGIVADDPDKLARAIAAAAGDHDLVVTSGGVSTGEADHVRHAVEAVGRLVFWRVAIKPGRPVAMGVVPHPHGGASAAFVGLPGNPAAVYVTFACVVRPLLLRLAGAEAAPLLALPVRAAFGYRKKAGRREYVRVKLTRTADGTIEAVKHAQEGAGIITSLTETDGLVELSEDTTTVAPGSTVGFLSYAALAA